MRALLAFLAERNHYSPKTTNLLRICSIAECVTLPMLSFKMRTPTRRHYFLRINFRPFSFFKRTMHAKINPAPDHGDRQDQ